jgi:hypothetical protein
MCGAVAHRLDPSLALSCSKAAKWFAAVHKLQALTQARQYFINVLSFPANLPSYVGRHNSNTPPPSKPLKQTAIEKKLRGERLVSVLPAR